MNSTVPNKKEQLLVENIALGEPAPMLVPVLVWYQLILIPVWYWWYSTGTTF
jgi:hypothetical protein